MYNKLRGYELTVIECPVWISDYAIQKTPMYHRDLKILFCIFLIPCLMILKNYINIYKQWIQFL